MKKNAFDKLDSVPEEQLAPYAPEEHREAILARSERKADWKAPSDFAEEVTAPVTPAPKRGMFAAVAALAACAVLVIGGIWLLRRPPAILSPGEVTEQTEASNPWTKNPPFGDITQKAVMAVCGEKKFGITPDTPMLAQGTKESLERLFEASEWALLMTDDEIEEADITQGESVCIVVLEPGSGDTLAVLMFGSETDYVYGTWEDHAYLCRVSEGMTKMAWEVVQGQSVHSDPVPDLSIPDGSSALPAPVDLHDAKLYFADAASGAQLYTIPEEAQQELADCLTDPAQWGLYRNEGDWSASGDRIELFCETGEKRQVMTFWMSGMLVMHEDGTDTAWCMDKALFEKLTALTQTHADETDAGYATYGALLTEENYPEILHRLFDRGVPFELSDSDPMMVCMTAYAPALVKLPWAERRTLTEAMNGLSWEEVEGSFLQDGESIRLYGIRNSRPVSGEVPVYYSLTVWGSGDGCLVQYTEGTASRMFRTDGSAYTILHEAAQIPEGELEERLIPNDNGSEPRYSFQDLTGRDLWNAADDAAEAKMAAMRIDDAQTRGEFAEPGLYAAYAEHLLSSGGMEYARAS